MDFEGHSPKHFITLIKELVFGRQIQHPLGQEQPSESSKVKSGLRSPEARIENLVRKPVKLAVYEIHVL